MAGLPEQPGPNPRVRATVRVTIGIAVVLLAAVLVWAVVLLLRTDPREQQALKTPHSILGVTVGAEPLVLGTGWQKLALRLNPNLAPAIGGTILRCPSATTGSLVVWQHYGRAMGWSGPSPMLKVSCSDELGNTTQTSVSCNDFLTADDELMLPFVVKNFPRRGRTVKISASDFAGPSTREPIWVPNPLPGPYPVWQSHQGPLSSRSGGMVWTLREFRHGDLAKYGPSLPLDLLRLSVQDPNGSAADWAAEKLEVSDATGNVWTVTPEHYQLQTTSTCGELHITCPSLVVSNENAFKVRLTLARVGNLPASETGVLRDLPVPKEGIVRTEHRAAAIQGSSVEVSHQLGARASHNLGWSSDSPDLAVWVRNPAADRVLRIRPPEGQIWEPPRFQSYTGCYCVAVPDSAVGKRISLEVGLTQTHTQEFIVQPTTSGSK